MRAQLTRHWCRLTLYRRNFGEMEYQNIFTVPTWHGAEQKAAMGNGRDRRRWVRHRFYAPVRISFEDRNQSSIIEGRCLKLSEGGMSLFAAANVAVGTRVKVDFLTSASEHHISVMGTIRNRMVYLYGVEY